MYTQGYSESVLRSHTSRTAENSAGFLLPHLRRSDRVLDIGCGPGTITLSLAKYVERGSVVGVDYSDTVIEEARKRLQEDAESSNVSFHAASVYELPYEDDTFDVVYAHQMLLHLDDAPKALREMRRVCGVGGLVACREGDWATTMLYPTNPVLERWKTVAGQVFRATGAEPDAGRRLIEWAIQAGYASNVIDYSSSNQTYAGERDASWWGQSWAQRSSADDWQTKALNTGSVTHDQLAQIAPAWLQWSQRPDSVYVIVCGQVLLRKQPADPAESQSRSAGQ